MTLARQALGKRGEDLAVAALERRGYAILARRYRTRHGELDIVCEQGGAIVFVEVKCRDGSAYGAPADAITPQKRLRLVRMASVYLTVNRIADRPCRFDVVSVVMDGPSAAVEIFQHAFDASY